MQINIQKQSAQGAIEYLLIIVAAIAVVAVVISFMISVLEIWGPALNEQSLSGLCKSKSEGSLDQNSLLCGCYLKDSTKGEKDSYGNILMASPLTCPEKLEEKYKNNSLLVWN